MIWLSFKIDTYDGNDDVLKTLLWAALRGFWRFSNFYGNYQALPPRDRRKFVMSQEKSKK